MENQGWKNVKHRIRNKEFESFIRLPASGF